MTIGAKCTVGQCLTFLTGRGEGHGMCSMHYQRYRRSGGTERVRVPQVCVVNDCGRFVAGRGWCRKHYQRWRRHGTPLPRLRGEVRDGRRICSGCEQDKPINEFSRSNDPCRPCVAAAARARRAVRPSYTPVPRTWTPCRRCGTPFQADGRRSTYCTQECMRAEVMWRDNVQRRARLANAFVEHFDRHQVFIDDDWTCRLCNGAIDPEVRYPDHWSASLDHIVPLAVGGTHERSNAQTAHWICNVRKGAREEVTV